MEAAALATLESLRPTDRADLIVAASRALSAWLRVNLRLGMRRRRAILRANERTVAAFGVDFLADAGGADVLDDLGGVPHGLRASGQHPDDLLERGSGSAAQFAAAWASGAVPVPLGPCFSEDLFNLYCAWARAQQVPLECHANLVQVLVRLYEFRATKKRAQLGSGSVIGPKSVLIPVDAVRPEGVTDTVWLGTCVDTFRRAALEFAATA
jgi:hypothetical protein